MYTKNPSFKQHLQKEHHSNDKPSGHSYECSSSDNEEVADNRYPNYDGLPWLCIFKGKNNKYCGRSFATADELGDHRKHHLRALRKHWLRYGTI